jgi:hypothetical protein
VPAHDEWAAPDLPSYLIDVNFRPIPGKPDMTIVQPNGQLPPGLYSLRFNGGATAMTARFGVNWPHIQLARYEDTNCVDKTPQGYQPCWAPEPAGYRNDDARSASDSAIARPRRAANEDRQFLAVRNLTTRERSNGGETALIIHGNVVNTSRHALEVPQLFARIMDAKGSVLRTIPFDGLRATRLAPGQSYGFDIDVANPPAGATAVRVTVGA